MDEILSTLKGISLMGKPTFCLMDDVMKMKNLRTGVLLLQRLILEL